jgi:hypothetical protein
MSFQNRVSKARLVIAVVISAACFGTGVCLAAAPVAVGTPAAMTNHGGAASNNPGTSPGNTPWG